MKISLAQMNVIPGAPERNVSTMLKMIEEAKGEQCDVIVFPEMCVGGYMLGDRWLDPEQCYELMSYNSEIKEASEGITIIYGNVYADSDSLDPGEDFHPNKDGRIRKYNAAYVYSNKKPVKRIIKTDILPDGVQPKTLLPNYRIFDDERYFFSLRDIALDYNVKLREITQPFMIRVKENEPDPTVEKVKKFIPIGIEICEDLWINDYRINGKPYNPSRYLINNGAKLIINISCSPWTYQKNGARDRRIKEIKEDIEQYPRKKFTPFIYVNNCGAQNNGKNIIIFDGGSTIYDKNANPVLFDTPFEEQNIIVNLDTLLTKYSENNLPSRPKPSKISEKNQAIVTGLQYFREIIGWKNHPKFIVGMSGGIDSAIVTALLVQALGKENVLGVNLPTKYNSEKTKTAAKFVADALEIPYLVVPIEDISTKITDLIENADFPDIPKISLTQLHNENIQAKIRGTSIISNLAAKYSGVFTNNGNKLEIALGYATLYGDVGGAIAPIGDLLKDETFEMARYLNEEVFKKKIIPDELIPDDLFQFSEDKIPPSAELKEAQIDPMKFGYHDRVLYEFTHYRKKGPEVLAKWYLDGTLAKKLQVSEELLKRWNIDNPKVFIEDLEWFTGLFYKSIFKRVQAPPIIITSRSAFGYDIRESQIPWKPTKRYIELKEIILSQK